MKEFEFDDLKRRLDFLYNGDFGILQHKTTAYFEMLETLLRLNHITEEQYKELAQVLITHFKNGLQDGINNALSYVR